jgi:hypothetical protein
MTIASPAAAFAARPIPLPQSFLSCYEVMNPECLVWSVRLYKVVRADGSRQSHSDRSEIKQAIWELRKNYLSLCRGYGFVVDVDEETVAIPLGWELPSGEQVGDYRVTLSQTVTTNPELQSHRGIISGILREAMKRHFKDNPSEQSPRDSRRSGLPTELIDGPLLMGHEHLAGSLIQLMQIRTLAASANDFFHAPPEAFNRIEMVATGGR